VPFLGAAANISAGDYQGLPLGGEVATRLLEKLVGRQIPRLEEIVKVTWDEEWDSRFEPYRDLVQLRASDLARVALHVEVRGGYRTLVDYVESILPDHEREPSRLLHTLARLPFRLIVTTNYDRLMERALKLNKEPRPLVVTQPVNGFTPKQQTAWQERLAANKKLILYKIHGTFQDQPSGKVAHSPKRSSILISEEDYIEFLTVVSDKEKGVPPPLIAEKLVDSILLFLGYGLEDWDFRTLFKGLIETLESRDRRMSFAIQRHPSAFWVRYWESKGVTIYDVDLYDFAEQLETRYLERYGDHGGGK
jgi:SIR2-like domain